MLDNTNHFVDMTQYALYTISGSEVFLSDFFLLQAFWSQFQSLFYVRSGLKYFSSDRRMLLE